MGGLDARGIRRLRKRGESQSPEASTTTKSSPTRTGPAGRDEDLLRFIADVEEAVPPLERPDAHRAVEIELGARDSSSRAAGEPQVEVGEAGNRARQRARVEERIGVAGAQGPEEPRPSGGRPSPAIADRAGVPSVEYAMNEFGTSSIVLHSTVTSYPWSADGTRQSSPASVGEGAKWSAAAATAASSGAGRACDRGDVSTTMTTRIFLASSPMKSSRWNPTREAGGWRKERERFRSALRGRFPCAAKGGRAVSVARCLLHSVCRRLATDRPPFERAGSAREPSGPPHPTGATIRF